MATRAGRIKDIGVTKSNLTEEDFVIERGLKAIISEFGKDHVVFAEEENDVFEKSGNLWVIDPISGTHRFIYDKPHYAIVLAHLKNHLPQFAVVYDPSVEELFTAFAGRGAFLNSKSIHVSRGISKVIVRQSLAWQDPRLSDRVLEAVQNKQIDKNSHSMAVNYCAVASGRADGIIAFTKDAFPEFAGSLIIKEAGGKFTNIEGSNNIAPTDRIFIGGNMEVIKSYLV